jgi:hypothetical protein
MDETLGLSEVIEVAKEEAIEELARNFRESNSLNNVKEKRKRYQQLKAATETQLMHQMQRQLTGAEEGLAMIGTAFTKVDELQSHFVRIDRLSSRCTQLIHQFPVVKEINRVTFPFCTKHTAQHTARHDTPRTNAHARARAYTRARAHCCPHGCDFHTSAKVPRHHAACAINPSLAS